jgi:hypothetical protein
MHGGGAVRSTIEHARQIIQLADPCGRLAGDIDEYVGIVNGILEGLIAEERESCAKECDGERMACERHAKALPKAPVHQVGIQIADVCARRIRARGKVST